MARSRRDALNVFVNAPFDPAYDPLLEAMVFMIHAAGLRARCALEEAAFTAPAGTPVL
jgi:hypothetical protein